jgi:hypothetical protein
MRGLAGAIVLSLISAVALPAVEGRDQVDGAGYADGGHKEHRQKREQYARESH